MIFEQTDTIEVSAFVVRSIQAAKSQSSSSPRKQSFRDLQPISQTMPASKFKKRELNLDL